MIVKKILYLDSFEIDFKKLPGNIQEISHKKVEFFMKNPLYPSLRLHSLKGRLEGLYSISVNNSYRIIFKRQENGDIIFISIGKHDIYRNL